MPALS